MKLTTVILRFGFSFVFFLSGILKGMDPFGLSLKLKEYFVWANLTWFSDYSYVIAIILCATEILFGLLLLIGFHKRLIARLIIILLAVFTIITFFLAIDEKTEIIDCGCFGEFLHLTPIKSLIKNIILLAFAIFYNVGMRKFYYKEDYYYKNRSLILSIFFSFGIPLYSMLFLPPIDFLSYNIGVNLKHNKDFRLFDKNYKNISNQLLFSNKRICFIIVADNKTISKNVVIKLRKLEQENTFNLYLITTPSYSAFDYGLKHLYTDEIIIKSIVRSKAGIVMIFNGVIRGKWNMITVPSSLWTKRNINLFEIIDKYELLVYSIVIVITLFLILTNKNLKDYEKEN